MASKANPDIRVKLAPEGVTEVVAALRLVQRESKTVANGITSIANGLRNIVAAVGIGAVSAILVGMGKSALDAAEHLRLLQNRTGGTIEELAALQYAAHNARLTDEQFTNGITKMVDALGKLRKGEEAQTVAFADLGLEMRDFIGLDAPKSLELIAKKAAQMSNGMDKTTAFVTILGTELAGRFLPLLNQLGERGLPALIARTKELGISLSQDFVQAATAVNESIFDMQKRTEGFVNTFLVGFIPGFQAALDQVEQDIAARGQTFTVLGQRAAKFLQLAIDGFILFKNVAATVFEAIGMNMGGLLATITLALKGEFRAAMSTLGQTLTDPWKRLGQGIGELQEDFTRLVDNFQKDPPKLTVKNDDKNRDEIRRMTDQLATGHAKATEILENLNRRINRNQLRALQEFAALRQRFFDDEVERRRALLDGSQAAATDQIRAAEKSLSFEVDSARQREALHRQNFHVATSLALQTFDSLSTLAERQIGQGRVLNRVQALAAQQLNTELTTNAKNYYDFLTKQATEYSNRYINAQKAIAAIDKEIRDNRKEGEELFQSIRLSQLTETQQFQERIRLANGKITKLNEAALAGNVEQARDLRKEIVSLAGDIAKASQINPQAFRIGQDLFTTANNAFEKLLIKQRRLEEVGSKTAQGELERVTKEIAMIQQSIAALDAEASKLRIGVDDASLTQTVETIRAVLQNTPFFINVRPNVLSSPEIRRQSLQDTVQSLVPGFARGGLVDGYTSPTADNLVARFSAGEYIQNARAVQHYGVPFMDAINARALPRFAEGGLVGGATSEISVERVELDLSINGNGIGSVFGPRATVKGLVSALRKVNGGLA